VAQGRFRADLMYRLRIVPVSSGARARRGDVELLAHTFIEQLNAQGGRRVTRIGPARSSDARLLRGRATCASCAARSSTRT